MGAAAAASSAQGTSAPGRQRRIAWFHFEERHRNPNELPEHWFAIGRSAKTSNPNFGRYELHEQLMVRPGFPRYGVVRFDQRQHVSGEHSFFLGLNGGSSGAFLEVGALGAVDGSDYAVTARMRTANLQMAVARVVAYLVDREGRKIRPSEVTTDLIRTDGQWQTVSVRLLGDFPEAAWIGLQVELRQPEYDGNDLLGAHQIVHNEVEGGAWFDDIAVWQLPRVVVRTQSDVNIVRYPDRPKLTQQVLDFTGRTLIADTQLYDHRMRPVDRSVQTIGPGMPRLWHWTPQLERYGWYLIDMQVTEPSDSDEPSPPVARSVVAVLWLAEKGGHDPVDARRFAIVAEDLPARQYSLLPRLMDAADVGAIVLSAWRRDLKAADVEQQQLALDRMLQTLFDQRRQVALSLYPMPEELIQVLDIHRGNAMSIFTRAVAQWRPYVAPVLMRQGQSVKQWQVMPTLDTTSFFAPDLHQDVAMIHRLLRNLTPDPLLLLPWGLNQDRRTDVHEDTVFTLAVPPQVIAHQLADYLEPWNANPPSAYQLDLQIPPADQMTQNRRITELVLRMLYGWEAGAGGLRIERPWTVSTDRRFSLLPDPLLGVFTTAAHLLAGRRVIGRLPLGHGLEAMIFDGTGGGMIAAWKQRTDADESRIDMYLGKAPVAVDVWGNRAAVPQVGRHHVLALTETPVFIEGIDPRLAMFRAAFRLDPPFIESKQVLHRRTLTVANPWSRTISGYLMFTGPEDWTIQPQRSYFSIPTGQRTIVPVALRFPASEVTGRKRLTARFEFTADQSFVVDASTNMEIGLHDLDLDANLSLENDKQSGCINAVVTAIIKNQGDQVAGLRLFANMAGQPRKMQSITDLKPGHSMLRMFRFDKVGPAITDLKVRVILRELSGPAVLNKVVTSSPG